MAFVDDDASDSSSDDIPINHVKQSLVFRNKLRCLSINAESAAIVDFLRSFLMLEKIRILNEFDI